MKYKIFCEAIERINKRRYYERPVIEEFLLEVHRFVYTEKDIEYRLRSNKHKKKTFHKTSVYNFYKYHYNKELMFSPYGNLHKKFLEEYKVQRILDNINYEYLKAYREKTTIVRALGSKSHARESIYRYIMTLLLSNPYHNTPGIRGSKKHYLCYNEDSIKKAYGYKDKSMQEALEFLFSKKRDVPDHRTAVRNLA